MTSASVCRSWRVVVAVLFGVVVLLGTTTSHEPVEAAGGLDPVGVSASETLDSQVVNQPESALAAGSVAALASSAFQVLAPAGGEALLLHCLAVLAGTCVVAMVGASYWLTFRRFPGFTPRAFPAPSASPWLVTVTPPVLSVRLRLCVAQV